MKIVKSMRKKKNSRISASSSVSYDTYTFDELTPKQQEGAINLFIEYQDDDSFIDEAGVDIVDIFNGETMNDYQHRVDELCDDFTRKTGITVHADKLTCKINKKLGTGLVPVWHLAEVFDTIEKENYTIDFYLPQDELA